MLWETASLKWLYISTRPVVGGRGSLSIFTKKFGGLGDLERPGGRPLGC